MPDPEKIDQSDDSVLGDSPVNENLAGAKPGDATARDPEDDPTE